MAAIALLASPAVSESPMAWPAGLYGDVRMSSETGDLGGFEARFYQDGERHMVEFVFCEGWCNETHTAEVVRGTNAFQFPFRVASIGPQGEGYTNMHVVVWPRRNGLNYEIYEGREKLTGYRKPGILRRLNKPFGISVANSGRQ